VASGIVFDTDDLVASGLRRQPDGDDEAFSGLADWQKRVGLSSPLK
jgi:hypothetical protein